MSDLINKLTPYNLFNNLLPGMVFSFLATQMTQYNFIHEDIVVGMFIYYFIGMVISRIGSHVLEALLKWSSFVRHADYKDFVKASNLDEKIDILSEQNNTYRSLASVFLSLFILKGYASISGLCPILQRYDYVILCIFLFLMFLFAYRKQTNYIVKRIDTALKDNPNQ